MTEHPISLSDVLVRIDEQWSPRIVTTVNNYDVLVAKVLGEHVWHSHNDTDELFLVLDGELHISLRVPHGERCVVVGAGEVYTVPRGVQHRPFAPRPTQILLLEPTATSANAERRPVTEPTLAVGQSSPSHPQH